MMHEILDYISWFCLIVGVLFCIIGAVGMLRLPDFYCRTHAATITDTLGAGLMLVGMMLQAVDYMIVDGQWQPGGWLVLTKLMFLAAFMLFTSPTSGHALVKAAYAHGVSFVSNEKRDDDA